MIHWMSDKVNDLLDNFKDGDGNHIPIALTVCDGSPKGHIELCMEVIDETEIYITLGDCTWLTDAQINARFIGKFQVIRFEDIFSEPVADYFYALGTAMEKTL